MDSTAGRPGPPRGGGAPPLVPPSLASTPFRFPRVLQSHAASAAVADDTGGARTTPSGGKRVKIQEVPATRNMPLQLASAVASAHATPLEPPLAAPPLAAGPVHATAVGEDITTTDAEVDVLFHGSSAAPRVVLTAHAPSVPHQASAGDRYAASPGIAGGGAVGSRTAGARTPRSQSSWGEAVPVAQPPQPLKEPVAHVEPSAPLSRSPVRTGYSDPSVSVCVAAPSSSGRRFYADQTTPLVTRPDGTELFDRGSRRPSSPSSSHRAKRHPADQWRLEARRAEVQTHGSHWWRGSGEPSSFVKHRTTTPRASFAAPTESSTARVPPPAHRSKAVSTKVSGVERLRQLSTDSVYWDRFAHAGDRAERRATVARIRAQTMSPQQRRQVDTATIAARPERFSESAKWFSATAAVITSPHRPKAENGIPGPGSYDMPDGFGVR